MPRKTAREVTIEYLDVTQTAKFIVSTSQVVNEIIDVYEDISNGMVRDLIENAVSMIHCNNLSDEDFEKFVDVIVDLREYLLKE